MLFAVRVTLSALRVLSNATLFLEAQRLLLRVVRPTTAHVIAAHEEAVLSAVPTSVSLSHLFVRDRKGHNIHIIRATSNTAPPGGPKSTSAPIVLLHGHSMSGALWYRTLPDLVSTGRTVYAIDLLGWGRSQRPHFSGRCIEQSVQWYISSLHSVLADLLPRRQQCVLVGHSLGAYLAFEYAARHAPSVERLVMLSPAATARDVPLSRALYFALPPQAIVRRGGVLGLLLFMTQYPNTPAYNGDGVRGLIYHLACQGPPSGEMAVRPMVQLRARGGPQCVRPLVERAATAHPSLSRTPLLVVVGDSDSSIRVPDVSDFHKSLLRRNYQADLHIIAGCDHCPQLEQPKQLFNIVEPFLQAT